MKYLLILLLSTSVQAADFTIQLAPQPGSVGDSQVSSISSFKISDLATTVTSYISSALSSFKSSHYVGSIHWSGKSGCLWENSTVESWVNLTSNLCAGSSVAADGALQVINPSTLGFILPSVKEGIYKIEAHGAFINDGGVSSAFYRFSDGIQHSSPGDIHSGGGSNTLLGKLVYSSAQAGSLSNVQIIMQGTKEVPGGFAAIYADELNQREIEIDVYYFPNGN